MAIEKPDDFATGDPQLRFEETRAALRSAAGSNDQPGVFPRSRVLQVALSPRYRWISAAVASAGAFIVWRSLPGRPMGLLLGAMSLARRWRDPR